MLGENAGGQGTALGFQFLTGPIVTVLASKTSRKYVYFTYVAMIFIIKILQSLHVFDFNPLPKAHYFLSEEGR